MCHNYIKKRDSGTGVFQRNFLEQLFCRTYLGEYFKLLNGLALSINLFFCLITNHRTVLTARKWMKFPIKSTTLFRSDVFFSYILSSKKSSDWVFWWSASLIYFSPKLHFYTPLKTLENNWFSDFFRGYRMIEMGHLAKMC